LSALQLFCCVGPVIVVIGIENNGKTRRLVEANGNTKLAKFASASSFSQTRMQTRDITCHLFLSELTRDRIKFKSYDVTRDACVI
jgi:hypothetical protein